MRRFHDCLDDAIEKHHNDSDEFFAIAVLEQLADGCRQMGLPQAWCAHVASFIATTNNLRPLADPTGSRRFICVYADEIDNSGIINYDQLYAELQQGRRYWFDEDENARIIQQNVNFLQVYDNRRMIELTYLSPEETDSDAKFILLQEVMKRLERSFPNFVIGKSTDKEIGRKLSEMGYEHKRQNKGAVYRIKER